MIIPLASFLLLGIVSGMPSSAGPHGSMGPHDDEHDHCCESKIVGGVEYELVGVDKSGRYEKLHCLSKCLYMKGGSERKYCFAAGEMSVECEDGEGGSKPPHPTHPTGEGHHTGDHMSHPTGDHMSHPTGHSMGHHSGSAGTTTEGHGGSPPVTSPSNQGNHTGGPGGDSTLTIRQTW